MQILNGIKRLIYGATTYLTIKQGSTSLRGTSYVELYRERTEHPMTIVSFEIKKESKNKAEFRFLVGNEKIFPFVEKQTLPDTNVSIIPIDISAGSLFTIEVKGMSPSDNFVIILSELCVIYKK